MSAIRPGEIEDAALQNKKARDAKPLVTVVIPSYNMGMFLEEAVQSVLRGELRDVEVLVIDDGSTDDTAEVMRPFVEPNSPRYDPRVTYLWQENSGKSVALNRTFKKVRGTYLTVLDADDLLTPESLAGRVAALVADPEADLAIGGFEVLEDGQSLGTRQVPAGKSAQNLLQRFRWGYKTPFCMNGCLMTRDLVDRVGPMDERLARCQDIDYSMRLLRHARGAAVVDGIVYRYRKHRSSRLERLRYRFRTAYHRSIVLWKNSPAAARLPAVAGALIVDATKAVYELFAHYHR